MTVIENARVVELSVEGDVLVATLNNPPVNALSHAVRQGLSDALDRLESDAGLVGMVLIGAGKLFCAGADVTEFGGKMGDPQLNVIIRRLDGGDKPVVAALQGSALGGGLELALACNARIAAPSARLSLPEVKLGILPGAGGIVRMPRLTGIAPALEMIAEGKDVSAARAKEMGLVDALVTGDVKAEAIALARRMAGEPARRTSALPFPEFTAEAQAEARASLAKKFRGRIAPQTAVDLFAMAQTTPYAEAQTQCYAACVDLVKTSQSRALRHIFAAERAAGKSQHIPAGTQTRTVEKVGVVGPGIMGRGIALAMLDAGLAVTLVGRSPSSLDKAKAAVAKNYDGLVKRGSLTEDKAAERVARLALSSDISALGDCDLVVETISENMAEKRAAIAAIDAVLSDTGIIVTNTSYLDVAKLADATTRPQNFAGMHFFNPANIMKLVENVRTPAASPDVLATLMALSKRLGKMAVLVGPSEGFVANRMLSKRTREGLFLLQEGATPAQVDKVLSGFGFPVGPFTLADMAGLDLMGATRAARAASMSDRERGADIAESLAAAGRLGKKSNAGYYAYGEDGKPKDDPATTEILDAHRTARGIAQREISDAEVIERALLAMVNEGAKLIDEDAVERASDIDVVWTSGLGFPAHLGGPMFWASEMGLPKVLERLEHYAGIVGPEFFAPSPLIARLADENKTFT